MPFFYVKPKVIFKVRDWLLNLFKDEKLADKDRVSILSGKPIGDTKDADRQFALVLMWLLLH